MSVRDKIYYYNRNGILKLTFNANVYFADTTGWNDWSWDFDNLYGKISNFRRSRGTYALNIVIASTDKKLHDEMCNVFTEDIVAGEPGKIMLRGWSLDCFVTAVNYTHGAGTWMPHGHAYTVQSMDSTWTRETTTSYNGVETAEASDLGRDYSMEEGDTESGRGYAEASGGGSNELMDSFGELLVDSDGEVLIDSSGATGRVGYGYSIVSSYAKRISLPVDGNGYRVTFYGAVTNPVIYLNGQPVRVLTSVASGERLVVTSNGREKTIYKVSAQGVKTDYFVYRDKEHTPFFSIGKSTELTYGEVKFDFTTIENRSEPSWN